MAKSEFASLLPESRRVNDVFSVAIDKYGFRFGSADEVHRVLALRNPAIQPFFRDVIETGVAHFALRGQDAIMREIGEITMQQLKSGYARTYLVSDIRAAASYFGVPQSMVERANPHSPFTVINSLMTTESPRDAILSLVPVDMLVAANRSPIEVLGYIAAFSSMTRDAAHQRSATDPELMYERASCVEARFVRHAMETEPLLQVPEYYADVLTMYPEERFREINYRGPLIPLDPRVN